MSTPTSPDGRWDIYQSDLRENQLSRDAVDYRRSLYTNTKPDHPGNWLTGEPCRCEKGDDRGWERSGNAMTVQWPRQPDTRLPEARKRQQRRTRGRSR